MQICTSDTSSDIYCVVAAVRLDMSIGQRVAQLEAVLSLAPINARVDDRSDQTDRVVVLIGVQLDTRQAVSAEVKTV